MCSMVILVALGLRNFHKSSSYYFCCTNDLLKKLKLKYYYFIKADDQEIKLFNLEFKQV